MTAGHDNTIIASIDGRTELNWFSEDGRVIRTFGRAPEYMLDMVELPDGQIVCISGNVSRWRPGDEHFMPMFPDIEEMRRVIPTPGALAYDPGRQQFFVYDLVYEALLIFDEDWKPAGRIPNIGPHDRPRMAVLPGSRLVFSALRISAPLVFNEANELLVDAADPASRGLFGSDNYALLNDMATGPDGGMHLVTFEGRLISYSRRPLTDEAKRKFEQEQQQRIDG